MASLRPLLIRTPPAWATGQPNSYGELYLRGGKWTEPDTTQPLAPGQPAVCAMLGPGQAVSFGIGGAYAAMDPDDDGEGGWP